MSAGFRWTWYAGRAVRRPRADKPRPLFGFAVRRAGTSKGEETALSDLNPAVDGPLLEYPQRVSLVESRLAQRLHSPR